jgi:hypothetical protein
MYVAHIRAVRPALQSENQKEDTNLDALGKVKSKKG